MKDLDTKHHQNGIYICIEGPQFSTRAELNFIVHGCDVIGMTNMPESKLALEAEFVMQVLPWLQITIVGIQIMKMFQIK